MVPKPNAPLRDDEILIRRIPPSSDENVTIVERPDGGYRAVSGRMSTRSGEEELSCSRQEVTSPKALLDELRNDNIDSAGWHVCEFRVSDLRALGLDVVPTPTESDPGHCSIMAAGGLAYPNVRAKKLAKETRILSEEEINDSSYLTPPETLS